MAPVEKPQTLKRPLSGYFMWIQSERENIKSKMEGTPSTAELTKRCAEVWRGLSEAEKKPWEDKSQKAKHEYETYLKTPEGASAMATYKEAAGTTKAEAKVVVEKPQSLKRPLSAYFMWLQSERENIKAKMEGTPSTAEITKKCAEVWRGLPEVEKKPWEDQAQKSKNEHEAYLKTPEGEKELAAYKEASGSGKSAPVEKPQALKRPLSAYFMWTQSERENIKAKMEGTPTIGDITKKCAEMWKGLSDAERKPWEYKAQKAKEEHEAYLKTEDGKAELAAYKDAAGSAKADVKDSPAKKKEDKNANDTESPRKSPGPKKRAKKETIDEAEPSPKRAKGKKAEPAGITLDDATLDAAEKAGFTAALRNLAKREDIIAAGYNSAALLKALQESDGLVNKAKGSLLGGA